jgi:hemin uptake protein HemP
MEQSPKNEQRKDVDRQTPNPPALPKWFKSDELFGTDRQIFISHQGAVYRLQITKQGKLILTK